MVFVYFIVGLINIFTQHNNYGIKIEDPNFDIRVRRSIEYAVKPEIFNIRNNLENVLKLDVLKNDILKTDVLKTDILKTDVSKTNALKREKRYAYYKKTRITYNDLLKYSTNNNNNSEITANNSQTLKRRYDIFNPNYNFLLNTTRNNQNNNTGVKNGITINRRPLTRSYPYGYAPGYEPRPNRATGYNVVTTTPAFYNYQNPNGPNFAGYVGYTANKPGYDNVTPRYRSVTPGYNSVTPGYKSVAPGYNSVAPGYNSVAPGYNSVAPGYNSVAPGYTSVTPGYNSVTPGYYNARMQYEPRSSPSTSNYPWNNALAPYPPSYSQTTINNNTGIHNLPYTNNNGTTASNNTYMPYIPASNTSVTPGNDYIFPSINDYNLPSNNDNAPTTNSNNITPASNTNVTPSNINSTVTTTPKTLAGCIICNIPCPQFMRKFGMYCRPENDDEDDY